MATLTDFHSHILPGIDDGSKSLEMTMEMLRKSAQQGVHTIVATPHFYATRNTPEQFYQDRQAAYEQLSQLPEGLPKVLLGAEVAYFDGMSRSQELEGMGLGDSRLLLVEMPNGPWSDRMVEEVCRISQKRGMQPVLAHIDRYLRRNQLLGCLNYLISEDVLLQVSAEAFTRFTQRGRLLRMVRDGMVDFLGSDAHNLENRAPNMDVAAQIITQKLGEEALQDITARSAELLGL